MALSTPEQFALESRIGPLGMDPVSEPENLEGLVELLGAPALAALHVLRVRYAEFVSSPAVVQAQGDGSVSHVANIAPMLASIKGLVAEITASTEITPTADGEAVLESARALTEPDSAGGSIDVVARSPRPG